MNASRMYAGLMRFEERSAALYLDLSVRFFDRPEFSWFWVEMAMEEKQHAGMLQYCREAGVFAEQIPDSAHLKNLKRLFEKLEAQAASPNLSPDDAFQIAQELEGSEINAIFRVLTDPIDGPDRMVRKKIELSVANHFGRLYDAARRFGASPGLQDGLAALAKSETAAS